MYLLWIVSEEQTLDPMYIPENLVWDPVMKIWLVKEAYEAFYLLKRQMQEDGIVALEIADGYRSYAYQKKLYDKHLKHQHYKRYATFKHMQCMREIAPPGCSEHQLGTAIDVVLRKEVEQSIWLRDYAMDFGFILRYPKDKIYLTGRMYDHTHYRYVGVGHAKKMKKLGLCLEEYSKLYKNDKDEHLL